VATVSRHVEAVHHPNDRHRQGGDVEGKKKKSAPAERIAIAAARIRSRDIGNGVQNSIGRLGVIPLIQILSEIGHSKIRMNATPLQV